MSTASFRQRIRYRFDNTMSKGTKALIGWLMLLTVALVVAGGALTYVFNSQGSAEGFPVALWNALMHVLDPGTVTGDQPNGVHVVLMLLITFGGIVIVSSLVGILTTGLDAKLTDLRKGRSLVVESGHTVVLGWSDQVFTIISELVEANESEKSAAIAILADRDKVEMEDDIRSKLSDLKSTKVVCRTGDPADPDDIAIVNPTMSKGIVLLTSDEADPDAQLVRSLLAVTHGGVNREGPHVVGAVVDSRNLPAARLAGGTRAQVIDATDVMARLMVQTCRQSGLSVVYTDLLDFGGDEMYLAEEPRLVGSSVAQAMHAYRTSCLVGLRHPDGHCTINPPSSTVINPGDRLILISEDDSTIALDGTPPMIDESVMVARGEHGRRPEKTLILGWNSRATTILEQLDAYVAPGSTTDVVSVHPDMGAQIRRVGPQMRVQALNYKEDDTTDRNLLESLDVRSYDHIIALCRDDIPANLADSKTLVTLLHLRDMAEKAGTKYKVVSEMADDRNRALAQVTQADDFIVSEKLVSLMLTQTAENPHLSQVFADLFDPEGSEIYLKPCEYYVRPGMALTFYSVLESARRRGELAIGFRQANLAHQGPNFGVVLNPDKTQPFTLYPGDKVIVLAQD